MKKFLITLVVLGVVLIGTLSIYDWLNFELFKKKHWNDLEKMDRLMGRVKIERVAIFGSSRASDHYIPDLIADDAYNYGVSGSAMNETLYLIRQRLKNFREGVIIINLDPSSFRAGWESCPYRGEYRQVGRRLSVFRSLPKGVLQLSDIIPGIRFWGTLKRKLERNENKQILLYIQGAQIFDIEIGEEDWNRMCNHATKYEFKIGPEVQPILNELYNSAAPGVHFVWVASPLAPCYDEKAKGLDGMLEFMKRQAEYPNVSYLSFIDTLPRYDRLECKDPYHLNKAGAIRFSKELRERLSHLL